MNASPQIAIDSPQNLADIAAVIARLPPGDLDAATAARTRAGDLKMESVPGELLAWLAVWQGKFPPRAAHPRIILFAADHGVAHGADPVAPQVERIIAGSAPICAEAEAADADLRLYELDLTTPTADLAVDDAMGEGECAAAIVYGMMAVEMGVDLVVTGAVSHSAALAAAALVKILGHAAPAGIWAAGSAMPGIAEARHPFNDPLELLRSAGGRDIAAILGVVIAARMARMPVILEGPAGLAAAAVLHRLDYRAVQHCLFVGIAGDDTVNRLAADLGLLTVIGEDGRDTGVAAGTVIPLLRAAIAASLAHLQ